MNCFVKVWENMFFYLNTIKISYKLTFLIYIRYCRWWSWWYWIRISAEIFDLFKQRRA